MVTAQRIPWRMVARLARYVIAGGFTTVLVSWAFAMGTMYSVPSLNRTTFEWSYISVAGDSQSRVFFVQGWHMPGFTHIQCVAGDPNFVPKNTKPRRSPEDVPNARWCESCVDKARHEPDLKSAYDNVLAFGWTRSITQTGWPMLALWCQPKQSHFKSHLQDAYGGIPAIDDGFIMRTLPLLPLWPGFLFDTLFYACLWFALLFAISRTRRFIRRRRGRCPMCGYQLNDADAGCSECGWGRAA